MGVIAIGALVVACSTAGTTPDASVLPGTPDGGACSTRGAFDHATSSICCHGQWMFVNDLFGLPHDSGPPDGGFPDASRFCETEGASGCAFGQQATCQSGAWTPSADVFCTPPSWCD